MPSANASAAAVSVTEPEVLPAVMAMLLLDKLKSAATAVEPLLRSCTGIDTFPDWAAANSAVTVNESPSVTLVAPADRVTAVSSSSTVTVSVPSWLEV